MPVEKSAGAVVFRCGSGNKIEYLVLGKHEKSWGFPKGLIERGEKLEEAARRETEEETGLKDLVFIDGFKQTIRFFMKVKYPYQIQRGMKAGETAMKFVTYFLMESKGKNVRISCEHNYFEWLSFDQALARLKRPMDQEVLKKVNDFINDRISKKSLPC